MAGTTATRTRTAKTTTASKTDTPAAKAGARSGTNGKAAAAIGAPARQLAGRFMTFLKNNGGPIGAAHGKLSPEEATALRSDCERWAQKTLMKRDG